MPPSPASTPRRASCRRACFFRPSALGEVASSVGSKRSALNLPQTARQPDPTGHRAEGEAGKKHAVRAGMFVSPDRSDDVESRFWHPRGLPCSPRQATDPALRRPSRNGGSVSASRPEQARKRAGRAFSPALPVHLLPFSYILLHSSRTLNHCLAATARSAYSIHSPTQPTPYARQPASWPREATGSKHFWLSPFLGFETYSEGSSTRKGWHAGSTRQPVCVWPHPCHPCSSASGWHIDISSSGGGRAPLVHRSRLHKPPPPPFSAQAPAGGVGLPKRRGLRLHPRLTLASRAALRGGQPTRLSRACLRDPAHASVDGAAAA